MCSTGWFAEVKGYDCFYLKCTIQAQKRWVDKNQSEKSSQLEADIA